MAGGDYLKQRGSVWHYCRRVPADVQHLDPRGTIRKSTKKRDRIEASIVADRFNRETQAFWDSLLTGETEGAVKAYDSAMNRARALGMEYVPMDRLVHGDQTAILERVESLEADRLVGSKPAVEAVLGSVDKPDMKLSEILDTYFDFARDQIRGKAPDQVRKWRNPRLKAIRNLIAVVGDKRLSEVTRNDALEFRAWWMDRVERDGRDPGSANKDIGAINAIINEVDDKLRLELGQPFARMRLKGERHNPRIAYEPSFVTERLLAPSALGGLNQEARIVIYVMCGTGMRPSEIVNLTPDDIRLDASVPHACIRPHDRILKTDGSKRDIPLVGVSLAAMKGVPEGFERYKGKADSLSASVNKYLAENGLRPTLSHTLYSLRHTFQDRLTAVECPERIQCELMGHRYGRPKYGTGPSLEQKAHWLERVSYPAPASLIAR